jgi:uncharacterized membrane protein (UPF0127 family)
MKKIFFIIMALFSFSSLGACVNQNISNEIKSKLVISTIKGEKFFDVEIADDDDSRRIGLMNRDYLEENAGMLFVFDKEFMVSMWMKNTKIPLDMIFFDENREVVDIISNAVPCESDPCPTYDSSAPAKFVLEINGGAAKFANINLGDSFNLQ